MISDLKPYYCPHLSHWNIYCVSDWVILSLFVSLSWTANCHLKTRSASDLGFDFLRLTFWSMGLPRLGIYCNQTKILFPLIFLSRDEFIATFPYRIKDNNWPTSLQWILIDKNNVSFHSYEKTLGFYINPNYSWWSIEFLFLLLWSCKNRVMSNCGLHESSFMFIFNKILFYTALPYLGHSSFLCCFTCCK